MLLGFDTIKARLVVGLISFVVLAHVLGLWVYTRQREAAQNLLHDTLIAEQVALVARVFQCESGAFCSTNLKVPDGWSVEPGDASSPLSSGTDVGRAHLVRHLLGAFLNRPTDEGIGAAFVADPISADSEKVVSLANAAAHMNDHHQNWTAISEIRSNGTLLIELELPDRRLLRLRIPSFSATTFSVLSMTAALLAMIGSAIMLAVWALWRWTQPLVHFADAAQRLGADIHAPKLAEQGMWEVRTAARAFNEMQFRLQKLLEDRSALAAAIAHDLGTPLTRLRLRLEDVEDHAVRDKAVEDLEQMRRMITATLEFARTDNAREAVVGFDLANQLDGICDEQLAIGGDVVLVKPSSLTIVSAPLSVRRAIVNLIDNALKYGRSARIELRESAGLGIIVIEDDGPGIPENLHEAVFRPFLRLDEARKCGVSGTGLGLTVARSLLLKIGGTIELMNRPEGGLRVTVSIPLGPALQAGL